MRSRRGLRPPSERIDRGRPVAILTGEYGARVLEPLVQMLTELANVSVSVLPVRNDFFGGNIAVTGLLTGADVARVLTGAPTDARYLLPDVTLSRGRFLDDTTPAELPQPVEVVPTDGASLVAALR
jgi:NifB/MoaA-like Fe-S oxidoreductase